MQTHLFSIFQNRIAFLKLCGIIDAQQLFYKGTAGTRILIAKEYGRALIGLSAVYGLGALAGATIETDPRSSDSGKLKFGNTRLDPLMGLSQNTVLLSRIGTGETKSLGTGRITEIRGKVPYRRATSYDVIATFLRTKLAPVLGAAVNIATGKNVVGQKTTPLTVAADLTIPLSFKDIYDVMKDQGVPRGSILELLSLFGMGLQSFDERQKNK